MNISQVTTSVTHNYGSGRTPGNSDEFVASEVADYITSRYDGVDWTSVYREALNILKGGA